MRSERTGIHEIRERVVQQERGDLEAVLVARIVDPVPLQGTDVVHVAELRAPRFEDCPVLRETIVPEHLLQVALQVCDESVTVEKGVVDVEQTHDRGLCGHPAPPADSGLCQKPSLARASRVNRCTVLGPIRPDSIMPSSMASSLDAQELSPDDAHHDRRRWVSLCRRYVSTFRTGASLHLSLGLNPIFHRIARTTVATLRDLVRAEANPIGGSFPTLFIRGAGGWRGLDLGELGLVVAVV